MSVRSPTKFEILKHFSVDFHHTMTLIGVSLIKFLAFDPILVKDCLLSITLLAKLVNEARQEQLSTDSYRKRTERCDE
ncbi:MAG: hypothetical protein C7B46_13040 [Sulfobacillus benefaciens]|uniref:Uncharacterized protein n=1 Tax=Sulfobacillus benefaciens TaxID=453960 RepID=A0A2T2XDX2_9FIRM|nr:MAG: hypothetical protein C7B46_13040 [Sulfobacillus benefaciens]